MASTVLFSRQPSSGDGNYVNYFSVGSRGETVKSRAVVVYEGNDIGGGLWRCLKDTQNNCSHVVDSKAMLQKLLRVGLADNDHDDREIGGNAVDAALMSQSRNVTRKSAAVSYLPILPPLWAALDTDIIHYTRCKPCREPPPLLRLDHRSTCPSCPMRTLYDPTLHIVEQDCIIYGLTEALQSRIQLQGCPNCPGRARRFIGPDPRNLGIFNLNNRVLFTHELLDDYTSIYTSSETPFTAWVTVLTRRYDANASPKPFVTEQVFRMAWFAYVDLQDFRDDMRCPKCGPMPEDVIWDGVTVGFNKKHILPTLRPPTFSDKEVAPVRNNQYIWKQQVLSDAKLRRQLRKVVKGAGEVRSIPSKTVDDSEDDEVGEKKRSEAAIKAEIERLSSIPGLLMTLKSIDLSLGSLCDKYFGLAAISAGIMPPKVYKKLFIQLAAEESVLQMLNKKALDELTNFNANPCSTAASQMIDCPVLLGVLKYHGAPYPEAVLGLCRWLLHRGLEVYNQVMKQSSHNSLETVPIKEGDWRETGCCYSLPQIRHRPVY
ncbi:hypothetical protein FPV67DRAFT_1428379, partial [Lyophyllum atratum]